jgi:ornithine cyclodeaminase/alanine dehydrogenase-like protein (mu-crystallin family)
MYQILTDDDVRKTLTMETAVAVMEQALRARAEGALVAPPRFSVEVGEGGLMFTAGAETAYSRSLGFRVYDTFPGGSPHHSQLVVVFDSQTGAFRGLVIGDRIGVMRTAAINAVAIRHMAPPSARRLGILGSGFQARWLARAAAAVRPIQEAKVYSPTAAHREAFAAELEAELGFPIEAAASAEEVVRFADVLLCATRSASPVLDAAWVPPGAHVNTLGPKFKGQSEIPLELAQRSTIIATDSLQQVDSYAKPFFLLGTPERKRMIELSEIAAGRRPGRSTPADLTLFCSVGLAGTEVALAAEALRRAASG